MSSDFLSKIKRQNLIKLRFHPSAGQKWQHKVKIPFFNLGIGNIRVNKCIMTEGLRMETALVPNDTTELPWHS